MGTPVTFEEEIEEYILRTGAMVTFQRDGDFVRAHIVTGPEHSARHLPHHSESPALEHVADAFEIAKRRHAIQCASTRCVSREVHGNNG